MNRDQFEEAISSLLGKHGYLSLSRIDAEFRFHGATRPDGEYVDDRIQSLWSAVSCNCAAPDLLEALANLLNRVSLDGDAKNWFVAEQAAARAAIAKARGEA